MADLEKLESRLREVIRSGIQLSGHRSRRLKLLFEFTLGQAAGIEESLRVLGHGDRVDQIHRELQEEESRPGTQIARTFLMLFSGRHPGQE